MNVINFPVQFIYQSNPPQTGDTINWLPIAFLILACMSLAIFLVRKFAVEGISPKGVITSKLSDFQLWVKDNVYAKVICIVFAVFAVLAIAVSFMTNNAYADNAQQDLTLDTGKITIYVSDSGEMTCSDSNIVNTGGLIYNLENTSVSLTDEAADSPLASSTIKIDSFGGCIYEGTPDGEVYDVTGVDPLYGSQSTKVNVSIKNLDKDSALKLCGKDVFVFSVMRSEVLNDYSWTELENIANDISDKGESSEYYAAMKKAAVNGETKTIMLGDGPDADRLFMRIIGINHDTVAGTYNKKAGLTFMATNAINKAFSANTHTIIGDWYTTDLNASLNTEAGEVYSLLNNALDSYGLTAVNVNKEYSKAYNSQVGGYDTSQITKGQKFFLPSYFEITGSTSAPGSETQFGQEGAKYEYMGNDIWSTIDACTWHDDPQYYPGSVMTSVNWRGYLWLQGAGSSQLANDVETAFDACDAAGGCVNCNYKIGSWERTIDKDSRSALMCMTNHGFANAHLACNYTSCVVPCYCLGAGTISETDLKPKPFHVETVIGRSWNYAPVFPDNQVPDGVKFWAVNAEGGFDELTVSKMNDLVDCFESYTGIYYTNPKGVPIYAVREFEEDSQVLNNSWNSIASSDSSVTYVNTFNDNSILRSQAFDLGHYGHDYWTGLNWHNNGGAPEAEPEIFYNNINQVGGIDTGVTINDVYEGYENASGSHVVITQPRFWSCVAYDSSLAYSWVVNDKTWVYAGQYRSSSTVSAVLFSRVFY